MKTIRASLCAVLVLATAVAAFGERTFEQEMALSIRAGLNQLTPAEKKDLLKEDHPILTQIADTNTAQLLALFAKLPDKARKDMIADTYLKWKYSDLDAARQSVFRMMVEVNIDMAKKQGMPVPPEFSVEELKKSEVGFAVVEIPETKQRMVSLFILWPSMPQPTWVTVVNGRAAGTEEYFAAHLSRLPKLKAMPASNKPEDASVVPQDNKSGERKAPRR